MNTTFPELEAAVPDAEPVALEPAAPPEVAGLLDVVMVRRGVVLVVVPFAAVPLAAAVMVGVVVVPEASAVVPVGAATNQSIFYRKNAKGEGRKGNGGKRGRVRQIKAARPVA